MDFLNKFTSSDEEKKPTTTGAATTHGEHKHPSSSELFASAKVVADAVTNKEKDKLNKERVADAAADLLDAAQTYGKLEETKGMGKYVQQAEDYLHNYKATTTTTTTTSHPTQPDTTTTTTHSTTVESSEPLGGGHHGKPEHEKSESGGGGVGDYFKMAEGFLKK
ncbi:hypothetical protein C5167_005853 [Papaver somniferum]|uniref:Nodulin-related protein 1 n=1 Tax=Papaver somniferum TaxID=3469 RepID=A0A4Y7JFM1_PAPSO|nr:nodulin-related protein 1-like [Papaver somniferum]RZC58549.1 hypothetical protein C5167_005853 [Papaver somniferum]